MINPKHATHREKMRGTLKKRSEKRIKNDKKSKKFHRIAIQKHRLRKQVEDEFQKSVTHKKKSKKDKFYNTSRTDFNNSIKEFEGNLERIGKLTTISKQRTSLTQSTVFSAIGAMDDVVNKKKKELRMDKIQKESFYYLKEIKKRKKEEKAARKERDHRRRKIMIDQQAIFKEIEKNTRKRAMIAKILKQSKAEKMLAEKLNKTKLWKDVIKRNRDLREQQYKERIELEKEEKKKMNERIKERMEEERLVEIKELKLEYEQNENSKVINKKEREYEDCKEIVNELIGLATKHSHFKQVTEKREPSVQTFNEWKLLFTEGKNLLEHDLNAKLINNYYFSKYNERTDEWKINNEEEEEEKEDVLIPVLKKLSKLSNPINTKGDNNETNDLNTSKFKIKACIIGKPFSGKSIICKKLSEKYKLKIINPESIIEKGLTSENSNSLIELAKKDLLNGKTIDDSIVVKVIVEEIKKLEESKEEIDGWIIDGFPNTLKFAKLFEREMNPNVKYLDEEEMILTKLKKKKKSLLFNVEGESNRDDILAKTSFNLIIHITVQNESIYERICGQLLNRNDMKEYHLTFNPPSVSSIMQCEIIEEIEMKKGTINAVVMDFNRNSKMLHDWYDRFNVMKRVNGNEMSSVVYEEVDKLIEKMITLSEDKIIIKNKEETTDNEDKKEEKEEEQVIIEKKELIKEEKKKKEDEIMKIEKKTQEITVESAQLLEKIWYSIETAYVTGVKNFFFELLKNRNLLLERLYHLKIEFSNFLSHEDNMQKLVGKFLEVYNEIQPDERSEEVYKNELHKRVSELRNELTKMSKERMEEAEGKINAYKEEKWINMFKMNLSVNFTQLLQYEAIKYVHATTFLKEFFMEMEGRKKELNETKFENIYSNVNLAPLQKSDSKKKSVRSKKKDKKGGSNANEEEDLHITSFEFSLSKAKELANIIVRPSSAKKKDKKKKKKEDAPNLVMEKIERNVESLKKKFVNIVAKIAENFKAEMSEIDSFNNHVFNVFQSWNKQRNEMEIKHIEKMTIAIQESIELEKPDLKIESIL